MNFIGGKWIDGAYPRKMSRHIVLLSLILLSLFSGILVFLATSNGPWGYSDSVAYIVSARNLIKGFGLGVFTPSGRFVITYLHPPLFPLLLSGIGFLGMDLVDAARWCNLILCIATVFVTGYLYWRHSRYPELAALAGILTIIFPTTLMMFTSSMSEPLFLFLFSLSGLLLLEYFQNQVWKKLFLAALICGLLAVTRYVGIAVIISAVVCVFVFSTGTGVERLKRSVVFGLMAGIPLLIWLAVLKLSSGTGLGGRSIHVDGGQLVENAHAFSDIAGEILWGWIPFSRRVLFHLFYQMRDLSLVMAFLVVVVITWISWRRLIQSGQSQKSNSDILIAAFFGVVAVFYLVFFAATWLFTVPQTPINNRLLLPIYIGITLGLLGCWAVVQSAWFSLTNPHTRAIPWLLMVIALYWYYPQVVDVVTESYKNDTITSNRWRDSQIIRALKDIPVSRPIISNKSEAVLMWADRPAYDFWENLNLSSISQDSPYGSDDADTAQRAFRQGAILVVFNDFPNQIESIYGPRGKERLATIFNELTVVGRYPDGTIYLYSAE